jgi:hypothetical protein
MELNTFDPKLKEAAKEIETILLKYDIMATMLLISPSHCEYLYHLNTSWSVLRFEDKNIRFRSKKEDFPCEEAQKFATRCTVHAITSFLQFGEMTFENMQSILTQLRQHIAIVYEKWK